MGRYVHENGTLVVRKIVEIEQGEENPDDWYITKDSEDKYTQISIVDGDYMKRHKPKVGDYMGCIEKMHYTPICMEAQEFEEIYSEWPADEVQAIG